jgi:flagellin
VFLSYSSSAVYSAQRAVAFHTKNFSKNIEQLATGKQITSAADDPSGMTMVSKLKAKIASADSAAKNISDAITLLSTTDSALETVTGLLQDIRADFVNATSGTVSAGDLDVLQTSINEKVGAINSIATQTEFNGFSVLSGAQDFTIQTGVNQGNTVTLNFRADTGTNYSGIAVSVSQEVGANDEGHMVENVVTAGFALDELSVDAVNINAYDNGNYVLTANGLTVIDTMIDNVSRMRSTVGGYISAMDSRLENLGNMATNWDIARSNREDVDVAKVSSEMSRNQILRESATAMLAQANSSSGLVLNLLP